VRPPLFLGEPGSVFTDVPVPLFPKVSHKFLSTMGNNGPNVQLPFPSHLRMDNSKAQYGPGSPEIGGAAGYGGRRETAIRNADAFPDGREGNDRKI